MKVLDKIGLAVFSILVLILSIIMCLLIFGWLDLNSVHIFVEAALQDRVTTNILLTCSLIFIALSIKCIFFSSEDKIVNGIKDGILMKNADGELVISKTTLEELVTNVAKGFDSAQNVVSKIILDEENKLIVYVTLNVKENAVIKELSTNIQTKVKDAVKKSSDLEVKEVNVSVRNLAEEPKKQQE